jgi:hypothetical protein
MLDIIEYEHANHDLEPPNVPMDLKQTILDPLERYLKTNVASDKHKLSLKKVDSLVDGLTTIILKQPPLLHVDKEKNKNDINASVDHAFSSSEGGERGSQMYRSSYSSNEEEDETLMRGAAQGTQMNHVSSCTSKPNMNQTLVCREKAQKPQMINHTSSTLEEDRTPVNGAHGPQMNCNTTVQKATMTATTTTPTLSNTKLTFAPSPISSPSIVTIHEKKITREQPTQSQKSQDERYLLETRIRISKPEMVEHDLSMHSWQTFGNLYLVLSSMGRWYQRFSNIRRKK